MDAMLDRAIWNSLVDRHSAFAEEAGGIRRYRPAFAPFAASADGTPESLAALADLVPQGGQVIIQPPMEIAPPPGLTCLCSALTVQMVAEAVEAQAPDVTLDVLSPLDAPEMLALARLTKPGPFAEQTNELGRFLGVRHEGRLVAMAGERLKPGPFTEVSGVCTHPDHRGRGYAAALLRAVARDILARGERPFLHAFADNLGAIGLYERLGFVTRAQPMLMVFARTSDGILP